MPSQHQFYRALSQPAARITPAAPPLITISRTGWALGGARQAWTSLPAAITITGLWAVVLVAGAALIMGGAA